MRLIRIFAAISVAATVLLQGCAAGVIATGATAAAVGVDRRTTGTLIEDQMIEGRVISAFHSDQELWQSAHFDVVSFNNVVLLTGEAPTEALRSRAEELARNADKVKTVYNEMIIAAPSSYVSRSSDSWITSKVKTAFVGEKGISTLHIKVVTSNGVVYLMGLLTEEEANRATERARRVSGVQRVVKLFEFRGAT